MPTKSSPKRIQRSDYQFQSPNVPSSSNLQRYSQDGKPYIREIKANPSLSGPDRGKGYTFVAMTRFDTLEDVKYYDEECEAHKVLKAFAHDKVQQPWEPPLTVFFED